MILTKKQYGKDDGYIAWHGYQSFMPDETTPQQAHEIGLKLAGEMWGDRFQIIVTTHLDKDHIHNHFAFNSDAQPKYKTAFLLSKSLISTLVIYSPIPL